VHLNSHSKQYKNKIATGFVERDDTCHAALGLPVFHVCVELFKQ
jgi:hypothetical protein